MEQAAVKAFFAKRADGVLDDDMYRLSESRDFTQGLVFYLIKSLTVTVPVQVTLFMKQLAKNTVASEASLDKT